MLATWGTSTGRNPTLDLQFAGATSLDNRITFSRGSQATLFDSTGALVYAKHNLFVRSAEFDNASWTKTNGTISANATTAPDGTTSADKFIPDNGISGANVTGQTISFVGGIAYTLSIFAKAAEFTSITVLMTTGGAGFGGGSNAAATFDLSNGTISQVERAGTTASIQDAGNGWYRLLLTATPTLAHNFAPQVVRYNPAGNGVGGVFIWGSQINLTPMEGGVTSSLSTYYPTVASAYYAPRFDYNPSTLAAQGLLIEEQRTNSIRNNTMQGAVAGTPGTLPTNWVVNINTTTGLTRSVVGTGVENGVPYIDLRIAGTSVGAGALQIIFEQVGVIAATNNQTWAVSLFYKIAGGSIAGLSAPLLRLQLFDNTNAAIGTVSSAAQANPTTASLQSQRISAALTTNNAATAFIYSDLRFAIADATAIDITLRIGLPQLEQGAFATSVIPTTTTALTRNADVASMTGTNFSSWYNASEGTVFCQGIGVNNVAAGTRRYFEINNNTPDERLLAGYGFTTACRYLVSDGGATQADIGVTTTTGGALVKFAGAYKTNDFQQASNGTLGTADTSGTLPTVDRMFIGQAETTAAATMLNGYIQRISYYPVRLPNSTLQALTA